MKSFLGRTLYWLFIIYLLYLISTLVSVRLFGYETLRSWFTNLYPNAYSIDDYSRRYFTLAHYEFAHQMSPALILTISFGILILLVKRSSILLGLERFLNDGKDVLKVIGDSFSNLSGIQRFALATCLIILLATKIYFLITIPYQVDEVFNFIFFVDKGPLHVTIFSNNHILYNLITTMWRHVIPEPVIASRITSLISSVMINILIYAMVRRHFNFTAALFVLMVTGLTFWTNVFSAQGYSYMLMTFCWLIALLSLFLWPLSDRRGFALCIVSSVAGFYCSKLFIIPFLAIIIVWIVIAIRQEQRLTRYTIIKISSAFVSIFMLSTLLYLPMWIWSGSDATFVTNVAQHDLVNKSPILLEVFSVMTEVNTKSYLVIACAGLLALIYSRRASSQFRTMLLLCVATIASLFLFIIVFHVYPPSRSLVFTNLVFYSTMAVAVIDMLYKTSLKRTVVNAILIVLVCVKSYGSVYVATNGWQNMTQGFQDEKFYRMLTSYANCIVSHGPHLIYADQQDNYLNFYLQMVALEQGQNISFTSDLSKASGSDVTIITNTSFESAHHSQIIKSGEFGTVYMKDTLMNPALNFEKDCINNAEEYLE